VDEILITVSIEVSIPMNAYQVSSDEVGNRAQKRLGIDAETNGHVENLGVLMKESLDVYSLFLCPEKI
jgi:hypothetical protein